MSRLERAAGVQLPLFPPMKITTIDKKIVDTDKLSDITAEQVELIEKSGIRDFAIKYGGMCYCILNVPNSKSWSTMHLTKPEDVAILISAVNNLYMMATKGQFHLVPQEINKKE